MDLPLDIVYRDVKPHPELEALVRAQTAKLFQIFNRIERCRVTLGAASRHQHKGNLFQVSVHLAVPGNDLFINRDPAEDHAHEDLRVALHDSFQAAQRRLRDYNERFKKREPRPDKT